MSLSCAFASDLNQTASDAVADAQDLDVSLDDVEIDDVAYGQVCLETASDAVADVQDSDVSLDDVEIDAVSYDQVDLEEDNVSTVSENDADQATIIIPETYKDLREDIENLNSGEVYNIEKDYVIPEGESCITILKDNIVINGNGHIIDAGGSSSSFLKIYGSNIQIYNLTFCNSCPSPNRYEYGIMGKKSHYYNDYVDSPIVLQSRNALFSDCLFINNEALNGGVFYITGGYNTIENCIFCNNTARGVGGAIYLLGYGNIIKDTVFLNSTSLLANEHIYVAYGSESTELEDIYFAEDDNLYIKPLNGQEFVIDPSYLTYTYYVDFAGETIDIVPLIFQLMANGGVNYFNGDYSMYGEYNNESGQFLLTIDRDLGNGLSYGKKFTIRNIDNACRASNIIVELCHGHYSFDLVVTATQHVSNTNDYLLGIYRFNDIVGTLSPVADYMNNEVIKPSSVIKAFNLVFDYTTKMSYKVPWILVAWDVLTVDGHGSTMAIDNEKRGENHWAIVGENTCLYVSNLTLGGYNSAIVNNGGYAILDHVNFQANGMDYMIDRDWGGAILNIGTTICTNCNFFMNYAEHGGAIFNQGILSVVNCEFNLNDADNKGDNICNGDGGLVNVDGKEITSSNDIVCIAESVSVATRTALTVISIVGSFLVGAVVGFITANPLIGYAVGAAVGLGIGTLSATYIISNVYDVNFNRVETALLLIGGSAAAGALGGALGGWLGAAQEAAALQMAATQEAAAQESAKHLIDMYTDSIDKLII